MIFSSLILYGGIFLLVLGGMILSLLKFYKKKTESGLLLKLVEIENLMGNSQFLYGSLNAIKQYMLTHSPMEAAQYLTEFTNLLKSVSSNAKQKNITLAQELETIILYLELEKKRFGNHLIFHNEIDAKVETDKIFVKPLFAFKQMEELIHQENTNNLLQISLVVRQTGKKLDCYVETQFQKSNFIITVPE